MMQKKSSVYSIPHDTIVRERGEAVNEATEYQIQIATPNFMYARDEKILKDSYLNFTVGDLGLYTGEVKFKISTKKINKRLNVKYKHVNEN